MKLSSWYDYSQVVYVNMVTPVIIICPIHAAFEQRPRDHMRGQGCPYCSRNSILNPKNKEEIKKYWIEHKITSGKIWRQHWKCNNLHEKGYPSTPWRFFKMTTAEWVEYVWGKKIIKTKEETKKYWLKNKIKGSTAWKKHWQDNNLRVQGYPSTPWESYKMICGEWTEYVWDKKVFKTKEETKKYWLENQIKGSTIWMKHWKCKNLQNQGYCCNPWRSYKMTKSEWTKYVCGKK